MKQALNHGLVLKKVNRIINFNQRAWLKPFIDMNARLRTKAKNDLKRDFFKLVNNSVFGKTTEYVRKHRVISTSNHMFKREIWDKFTECTFLKI